MVGNMRLIIILALMMFSFSCDEIDKKSKSALTGVLNVPADFATIQSAINAAAKDGAQIKLADGVYSGEGNCDLDTKGKHIRITGNLNDPELVVIDCESKTRAITFSGGENRNTILEGLTIANGRSSGNGGGLAISGMPVISNCIIMNNVSEQAGGGVSCNAGSMPTFRNCLFFGNISLGVSLFEGGGAIYCDRSEPMFINCTISRNKAVFGGGIFSVYKSSPTLINTIIWGNDASTSGNEIFLYKGGTASGKVSLFNCDFANNLLGDVDGNIETVNCINDEPGFVDFGSFNFVLADTSVCVNAGDDFYLSPYNMYDLQGLPRIANGSVDIGAYEAQNSDLVPSYSFERIDAEQSLEVQFTDESIGEPSSWSWDFDNDGNEDSTEQNPLYTYTQTGLYTVTLTITKGTETSTSTWKSLISFVLGNEIIVPDDFANIQDAIFAADDGDTITVLDGTYSGYWNRNIDFMGKSIFLISDTGAENTVIDCENLGRGFIFSTHEMLDAILQGFTIINGFTEFSGSGILIIDSDPLIKDCVVRDCEAGDNGGAICLNTSSAQIEGCKITNNIASNGAGLFVCDSACSILDCEIVENTATSFAGGIYIENLNMLLQNSVIKDNTAGNGAGIYILSASVSVNNCLIVENEAAFGGGGLYLEGKSCLPKMQSCTISRNRAKQGGGSFVINHAAPTYQNTIIWSNLADDGMQFYASIAGDGTGSIILTNCDYGATNVDIYDIDDKLSANHGSIIIDPRIVSVDEDDYYLADNSPCINSGTGLAEDYEFLLDRTAVESNGIDYQIVDIGYHYPIK